MTNDRFILTREGLAEELHRMIREISPEQYLDGNTVHKMLIEDAPPGRSFIFPAADYAARYGLEPTKFLKELYRELSIEFEKNLHDKFLFAMSRDESYIYFRLLEEIS